MYYWRGNWDKNGIESSFVPLNYVIGSDFISLDLTPFLWIIHVLSWWEWTGSHVLKIDFWSLDLCLLYADFWRCVVRRNFYPNSAGFHSGACSILCRPDNQVLCSTHQTRNSSVLFFSCQTSQSRVAILQQKRLPQNCIDKLKLFCNPRSGESQAGLLFLRKWRNVAREKCNLLSNSDENSSVSDIILALKNVAPGTKLWREKGT